MTGAATGVVAAALRVLLSCILARAGLHKAQAPRAFLEQLRAYRALPATLTRPVAIALTIAELSTAAALLNFDWRWPAAVAAGLFALYGGAMALNLARGRTDLDCGCSGPLAARTTIDWMLVARNVALTFAALFIFVTPTTPLAAASYWIVIVAGAALVLLYEAAGQALANRQSALAWQRRALQT